MAFLSKKPSNNKVFLLVFGIAFGLVGLAMAFQGVKTASDLRSRAGAKNEIYRQWEFNGKTTAWITSSPYRVTLRNGYLVLSTGKSNVLPVLRNTSVDTKLPKGLKTISISLMVGPSTTRRQEMTTSVSTDADIEKFEKGNTIMQIPEQQDNAEFNRAVISRTGCQQDARVCSDGTIVGRSGSTCSFLPCGGKVDSKKRTYTALLYYKLSGQDKYERPITFNGSIGSFQTQNLNLPQGGDIKIDSIRIVFTSGVKSGEVVTFDWIRLLGSIRTRTMPQKCVPVPECAYKASSAGSICKLEARRDEEAAWCPAPTRIIPTPTLGAGCKYVTVCQETYPPKCYSRLTCQTGPLTPVPETSTTINTCNIITDKNGNFTSDCALTTPSAAEPMFYPAQ